MKNKKQDKNQKQLNRATSSPCYMDQFLDYFGIEKGIKSNKNTKKSTPTKES